MTAEKTTSIACFSAVFFAVFIFCTTVPANTYASDIFLGSGGGDYQIHTRSLLDSRFRNVVRQQYDFSCGSAAIATLLTYHYDNPVEEKDILDAMYRNGEQEKIRREGFSLLDMKRYLDDLGYNAQGYRESLDKLASVGIPAIVLINKKGYLHFVVIKGVNKDKVAVGDPTLGLRIYTRKEFEAMWNGILFVLMKDKNIAHASFNSRDNWSLHGRPSFENMLTPNDLGNLTLDIAYTPNYY